jgi:hypothetical protein
LNLGLSYSSIIFKTQKSSDDLRHNLDFTIKARLYFRDMLDEKDSAKIQ